MNDGGRVISYLTRKILMLQWMAAVLLGIAAMKFITNIIYNNLY
jgi:hypothetical protein